MVGMGGNRKVTLLVDMDAGKRVILPVDMGAKNPRVMEVTRTALEATVGSMRAPGMEEIRMDLVGMATSRRAMGLEMSMERGGTSMAPAAMDPVDMGLEVTEVIGGISQPLELGCLSTLMVVSTLGSGMIRESV